MIGTAAAHHGPVPTHKFNIRLVYHPPLSYLMIKSLTCQGRAHITDHLQLSSTSLPTESLQPHLVPSSFCPHIYNSIRNPHTLVHLRQLLIIIVLTLISLTTKSHTPIWYRYPSVLIVAPPYATLTHWSITLHSSHHPSSPSHNHIVSIPSTSSHPLYHYTTIVIHSPLLLIHLHLVMIISPSSFIRCLDFLEVRRLLKIFLDKVVLSGDEIST